VVVNTTAYLARPLLNLLQGSPEAQSLPPLLDYPNCGRRNNDTFNRCSPTDLNSLYCFPEYGGWATANWSRECMWDCTWKANQYLGASSSFTYPSKPGSLDKGTFISTLPRIPVDLRCLDGCVRSANTFDEQCSGRGYLTFLICYVYNQLSSLADPWVVNDYFGMAVEFCLLAYLKPDLYNNGNCSNLNVNLSIFNPKPNLKPPYLDSSLDINTTKLTGPNQGAVSNAQILIFNRLSAIPLKRRHPWACSLQTQGYTGIHRCGVTLLSGPPNPTIFVSAAHCNYVCKNSANQVVQICCCQVSHIYKNI